MRIIISYKIFVKIITGSYFFIFNRYGSDIGEFNVYTNSSAFGLVNIHSIKGEQEYEWIKLSLELASDVEYRIVLEAVIGDGSDGDIAIDDISYKESLCNSTPTTSTKITTTTTLISTTTTTTTRITPLLSSTQTTITTTTLTPTTSTGSLTSTTSKNGQTNNPDSSSSSRRSTTTACLNSFCQNGGSCSSPSTEATCKCKCICKAEYTGDRCEEIIETTTLKKKCKFN